MKTYQPVWEVEIFMNLGLKTNHGGLYFLYDIAAATDFVDHAWCKAYVNVWKRMLVIWVYIQCISLADILLWSEDK